MGGPPVIGSVRKSIDAFFGWLNAPVANAAGRLGLFRIIYGLFYLWYLATQSPGMIGITPNSFYEWPITILQGWPMPPSVAFIENIESLLAGCLVLLTIGCWTRTMNVLVLALGMVLEGYVSVVDVERSNAMMAFFIPCYMLLVGNWHTAWSVDALRNRSRELAPVDPREVGSSFKASKLCLLTFVILFMSAGYYKITGSWLEQPAFIGHATILVAIDAAFFDLYVNPYARFVADTPWVYSTMMWGTILFECFFFVCLLGRRVRVFVFSMALLFHTVNAIYLWVTFTGIMITYGAFLDWQRLADRIGLDRIGERVAAIPHRALYAGSVMCAAAIGIGWNSTTFSRSIFTAGDLITFQTIWIPVPIFVAWWCYETYLRKRDPRLW